MLTALDNKRIAKNTLLLYIRMLFTMAVSLYTSRVVLQTLGVEDYGIYNVVGGIIVMFTFLNGAMSSATQRYLTFSLGRNDTEALKNTFSAALQIHALIAAGIVVLGETVGLWFLYRQLVIPAPRMEAAVWVYQCSIVSMVVSILSVPYNADIIAHEKMSAFAYISIYEALLKLFIVGLLVVLPFDKLKLYALLVLAVYLLIRSFYTRYCHRHFPESFYVHQINKTWLKEMGGFAGWSFWGNLAGILYTQGLNMMLNVFFGPVVNAARAVAVQVQAAVQQFVGSFQTALNPQITKTFAQGDLEAMHTLMFRSARFSFFLIYLLALPLLLDTHWVLSVWLTTVPHEAVLFTQWTLAISLIYSTANPCIVANQATGQVKRYQMVVGCILLLILPLSYLVLLLGAPAYSVFVVHFCVEAVAQGARMGMLRKLISLSIRAYLYKIYLPIFAVAGAAVILPMVVHSRYDEGWIRFLLTAAVSVVSVSVCVFLFGLTPRERAFFAQKLHLRIAHCR